MSNVGEIQSFQPELLGDQKAHTVENYVIEFTQLNEHIAIASPETWENNLSFFVKEHKKKLIDYNPNQDFTGIVKKLFPKEFQKKYQAKAWCFSFTMTWSFFLL